MNTKNTGRYKVLANEDFEPGSKEEVLKNLLGVRYKKTIEQIETQELKRAELELLLSFDENHQFTSKDIRNIHKIWLKNIYPFAGKYRTVNLSKEGFAFAGANYIRKCMKQFEEKYLAIYTPCHLSDDSKLAYVLGVVHVEFILIHPFREGNGRVARLLATLMALQAKKPLLNFDVINQLSNKNEFRNYIKAIHAGVLGNYGPIQKIFKKILKISI